MTSNRAVSIRRDGDLAVVTVDNPPVNALSQIVRNGLFDAVVALDADDAVRGVVLSCAGRTFIAGADVSEFGKPPMEPHLPDVVAAIEAAKKPWLAAIHGTALGGGFEIAMGCRFRIASKDAQIGLPEVTLGIIPGAGGTVRTPRLAGVENAVELITTGRPVTAAKALAMGLIDDVARGDLLASALEYMRAALKQTLPEMTRARPLRAASDEFWTKAEQAVRTAAPGEEAPLRALSAIRHACRVSFDDAMAFERETFLALRASPQAAALRAIFFAERAALRPPELNGIAPRIVKSVGIVGGGAIGAGIAAALRDSGLPVVMVEHDQAALDRGLANVKAIFDSAVQLGRIAPEVAAARMVGVVGSADYAALSQIDLVIEATIEDTDVKRDIVSRLGAVCRAEAIFATTTSSLDPRTITAGIPHPDRVVGLHFFAPAQVTKLLEIVPLPETAPDVLATAFALARSLNKIPVRAGLCHGFIGHRILKVMQAQAERVLLTGVAPTEVDRAMRAFGLAMGPFEAKENTGRDHAMVQQYMARERGEIPLARVADKSIGSKNSNLTPPTLKHDEIAYAILFPMINEGAKILAEGIAKRAADIDLVEIHGLGFPRHTGGLMHYATGYGLQKIVTQLEQWAVDGLVEPPCDLLRRAADAGGWSPIGF